MCCPKRKKVLNSHISHSFKHDYGFKNLHTCENVCRGYRVIDSIAADISCKRIAILHGILYLLQGILFIVL